MSWWQYLILVNLYLVLFYVFYAMLLKQETFFQLNRIYLVASAILSFVIPLIQADWVKALFITQRVQYTIYSSPVMVHPFGPVKHTPFTVGSILVIIYLGGIIALTTRLIRRTAVLRRMLKQPKTTDAYSFFRKINIGDAYAGNHAIQLHEKTHARQLHTADVMLAELVMIINWFNPVVYLYRAAVKNVHEFIADSCVLSAGSGKKEYALLLLSQAMDVPANALVNRFFNSSLLKQRIVMLQKTRSNRISLVKYGFSAPLFIMMLILSSATVNNSKAVKTINSKIENIALLPPSGVKPVLNAMNNKLLSITIVAPTPGDTAKKTKVFTAVDQAPSFPGGLDAFYKFLGANIHYPADMREKKIQGRCVISFIVEQDGSLSGFTVVRSLAPSGDAESIRALKLSPNWIPGYQNGKAVRVQYTVPISYALPNDTPANKTGAVKGYTGAPQGSYTTTGYTGNADTAKVKIATAGQPKQPLYIIDGKEASGFEHLDPKDIETIMVLKDQAAAAKYGDKGKNGVVLITTKTNTNTAKPKSSSQLIDNTKSTRPKFTNHNF